MDTWKEYFQAGTSLASDYFNSRKPAAPAPKPAAKMNPLVIGGIIVGVLIVFGFIAFRK